MRLWLVMLKKEMRKKRMLLLVLPLQINQMLLLKSELFVFLFDSVCFCVGLCPKY